MKAIQLQHKCPLCRNALYEDSLLEPAPEESNEQDLDIDIETQSSKTESLVQIIRATLKNPGSKVIVFSQWTSFLNIVQKRLTTLGYKYARVDGSMTPAKRDKAIHALDHVDNTRIMLASLAVCSVGLNLVSADTVILCDSCEWALVNPLFFRPSKY
jgi:SWI/SNF-related matrix-associated actin-dependent regulator of chromatin subfamily A3